MIIRTLIVGPIQCNCCILGCEATREALVIDPGDEVERILKALEKENLVLKAIFHTHAHLDHVGASAALARATGAPILLHEADLPLWEHVPEQAAAFGFRAPSMAPVDRYLQDGESVSWGRDTGVVLHTPGHTPGSISLYVAAEARLFSGDTLFAGSIGRTDLWMGDERAILRSIRERILTLPDETIVVPGHGPATSIGEERRSNPFVADDQGGRV